MGSGPHQPDSQSSRGCRTLESAHHGERTLPEIPTVADLPGKVRLRVAPSPETPGGHRPHVAVQPRLRPSAGRPVPAADRDTDRARFRADSEQQVFDTLEWLGLTWDEGPDKGGPCAPYRQSERLDTYRPYVDRLLAESKAYECWCSTERLTQMREIQQKTKQPTGYDRLCLGKTREEQAALPGSRRRRSCACSFPTTSSSSSTTSSADGSRRLDPMIRSSSRPTGSRPITWPSSWTTTRWGSRTSCGGRVDLLDAQAHPALPLVRPGAAAVGAHALAAQHRQVQDLQAEEPCRAVDLVPGAGLPARGS